MAYILTSYAEIIDKYTILLIKLEKISDVVKLENVQQELTMLLPTINDIVTHNIQHLCDELKQINLALWEIEDSIRIKEKLSQFDNEFISLARSVYITNDQRANIKYKINQLTFSPLIEEKSYSK